MGCTTHEVYGVAKGKERVKHTCWTYSHHCQIADKNPSKDGTEISGVSYMCWIDFHNEILCCGFLCARLISICLFRLPRRGVPRPTVCLFRLPRRGLPRPTRLFSGYHAEGYHARTDTFKLTGYHVCRVTTAELPRSKQTSGYRQVITPAGSF